MNLAGSFIGIVRSNKPRRLVKTKRHYRRSLSINSSQDAGFKNASIRETNHLSPEEINRLMYSFQRQSVIIRRWRRIGIAFVSLLVVFIAYTFFYR